MALVESLIPNGKIRERLGKLCVGLATHCDPPLREDEVGRILQVHFPGAPSLPFVGILTHDLQWVGGWAGGKTVDEVLPILAAAEDSPLRPATPDAVKKLETLAAQAAAAEKDSDFRKLLATSRAASELKGRSALRDPIVAAVARAREWAAGEVKWCVEALKADRDHDQVRVILTKTGNTFAGEPEGKECETGLRVLGRLATIASMPAQQQPAARAKSAKEFAGTPWAALFPTPETSPGR